ncbi:MAG TPA: DUF2459 domain-containing protein [Ignavibacteriaceae bacterium]|jgi:uncharacterized protein (TIGR02117 family)|nr:MAG: hypothetical protein BWY38_00444 [Ignavibacteria bacterium ADurb.Bin266]OQY73915.1 MAG: hypothetical protein B6D44_05870 [Ignavibacteriales bacterium UTCHB2]HQF43438.1 DUF2459 domain-containing protein [Ignavibacteriaceae bacterium]
MNTYNIINFLFIFLFLSPYSFFFREKAAINKINEFTIYFIKQNWHTAIVFETKDLNPDIFCEYKNFKYYNLIDIGWGDEEFYQHPGFDLGLAIKALFYKTPSALRVEGINLSKENYFNLSEIVVELKITKDQLLKICEFINNSFLLDEDQKPIILSKKAEDKIVFYKAKDYYYIFNTCNTWLANGLKKAGFEIEDNIILTEQLFNEAAKIGNVVKAK